MRPRTRAGWRRTADHSRVVLCHFPSVSLQVYQTARAWAWRVRVSNEGVGLGEAASRAAAEAAAVAKMKEIILEIERNCP